MPPSSPIASPRSRWARSGPTATCSRAPSCSNTSATASPKHPHDLVAVYDRGNARVILQGTVPDQPTRERILDVARDVPGVASVDDRMTTAR